MMQHRPPTISRRALLRGAGAAAAFAAAGAAGLRLRRSTSQEPWNHSIFAPVGHANVAIVRAASYNGDLEGLLFDGLRSIGADVRGASVLLKPNMVEFDPGAAINTDPRLVAAAVAALRRLDARRVVVGEAPGHRRDTGYVVRASGLRDALAAAGAPFVDMNVASSSPVSANSTYTRLGQIWLPEAVQDADVVISMPKMKTHHWAGVTLSLKNCFGCLPGRVYGWPKNALHWQGIEPSILDIAGVVRPAYAIVDGITAMEGNGPIDGTPKDVGLVVIGDDPVATDATTAALMGFDPSRIAYIAEAGRFLGQADLDRIVQHGEDVVGSVTPFAPAPGFDGVATAY
jgi:uncharacterized protein (DUF362 family)